MKRLTDEQRKYIGCLVEILSDKDELDSVLYIPTRGKFTNRNVREMLLNTLNQDHYTENTAEIINNILRSIGPRWSRLVKFGYKL